MKRYNYLILFLTGWLITLSCMDDRESCVNKNPGTGEEVSQTFTLQLPSTIQYASTYGMGVEDENKISTLDVFLFKVDAGEEKYAYRVEASSIKDKANDPKTKEVTLKLKADNQSYRLVFLANVRDEINAQLVDLSTEGEKDRVMELLTHTVAANKKWNTGDVFPMWGESSVWTISDNINPQEEIKMIRAVARIDVITTEDAVDNFEIQSAYVYKYHRKGHVVPHPDHIGNDKKAHTATIPSEPLIVDKTDIPYTTTEGAFIQDIYVYESEESNVHLEKTCIVVGGIYKPKDYTGDGSDLQPSYYRIDFLDDAQKDIPVLRNYCYVVKIKSVTGGGYTDPDTAYESKPFNLDVEVMEWNQGDITDIVFGQYFLGVSSSEIHMPAAAATTSIIVTTDYPGYWTSPPVYQCEGTWLAHHSGSCSGIKQKDDLFFNLDEHTGATTRIGYIHLQAGPLKHTITVYQYPPEGEDDGDVNYKQEGEANCYILSPNWDGIEIPVSQANKDQETRIGPNDELVPELLWTDRPYALGDPEGVIRLIKIEGKGDKATLKVAANKYGNAVVAVKVDGEIKWSWHIWVLDLEPEETARKCEVDGVSKIFIDRNLGALSGDPGDPKTIGLTYQWGRKDPFPGLAGFNTSDPFLIYDTDGKKTEITLGNVTHNNMVNETVKQPMNYFRGNGDTGDWYGTNGASKNDNLWVNRGNEVSPYDPCPAGWTVDLSKGFVDSYNYGFGFSFGNNGVYSDKMGYFPMSGFREKTGTFNISDVGEFGYYWFGSSNGNDAAAYRVEASSWNNINTGHPSNRASGFAVRCIKME